MIIQKFLFYKKLCTKLDLSNKIYRYYLDNKKLSYAKILRKVNETILKLLYNQVHLLENEAANAAFELIIHFEVWLAFWDEEFDKQTYNLNDPFVFENHHSFPKNAEKTIMEEYLSLKKQI